MPTEVTYPIKAVSQKTGLSPHVIRVWERRYRAIEPKRTDTNRRRYSEAEMERLMLLSRITASGHSISSIAALPTETLRTLIAPNAPDLVANERKPKTGMESCLEAVRNLDGIALDTALRHHVVSLGHQGIVLKLIAPLAKEIGDLWQAGEMTAAHEHFATAIIRDFLRNTGRAFGSLDGSLGMVVGTPVGQMHELGAVLAASIADSIGWRVTYLGSSLPAAEIAGAAITNRSSVVALSIVFPDDDPRLHNELVQLRQFLPEKIRIIAGGRASAAYARSLQEIGATRLETLEDLNSFLEEIRRQHAR